MSPFWGVVASNAAIAAALAVVATLLGRAGRGAAAAHLLWVAALLKLFAPPLVVAGLPIAWTLALAAADPEPRPASGASGRTAAQAASPPGSAVPYPPGLGVAGDPGATLRGRPAAPVARSSWSLDVLFGAAWLAGAGGVATVHAARIRRFRAALRDAEPAPADVRATVADLAGRLGLRRVPEVRMTPHALPPLVWSLGRGPRVILPAALLDRLGPAAREAIVAHELAHVRRGDHLVRLLEVAARTVFWWHPVAWLAGRPLRELEEECVDARVVALLGRPRAYAAALVDTLEFLAGRDIPPAPLRTANDPTRSLTRRLQMLARPRSHRLDAQALAFLAVLLGPPLTIAFAQAPKPPAAPAVLSGRVTDEAGKPVADARVLVAAPAVEMRQPEPAERRRFREARTDTDGGYRLELPGVIEKTKASVDVLKPGFRRLSGTLMAGGDPNEVEVTPGREAVFTTTLKPARYYRGVAIDERGQPVAGAEVVATLESERGTAYVEIAESGPDGVFELFNFAEGVPLFGMAGRTGVVRLSEPGHVEAKIADVDAIDPARRGDLRVVLDSGRTITGTVLDVEGNPVAGAMVEVELRDAIDPQDGRHRKAVLADAAGKFALRGLCPGLMTLTARAYSIDQKARLPMGLNSDRQGLELRLKPIDLPADLKRHDVLGMQLADLTSSVRDVYDWHEGQGVVVLDPGPNRDRLGLGEMARGDQIWLVGDNGEFVGVHELVDAILTEVAGRDRDVQKVRVAYNFRRADVEGAITTQLTLTRDDIAQLRALSERLAGPAR